MAETRKLKAAVLDAGTLKKREIRALQESTGDLAEEAHAAAKRVGSLGSVVVPVVIMYEKRSRKQRGLLGEVLRKL